MLLRSLKNQRKFALANQKPYRKFYTPFGLVIIKKNVIIDKKMLPSDTGSIYLGMKVSRKLGNAVVRNKIKRRIRHLARLIIGSHLQSCINISIIVIPIKGFDKILFADILSELRVIFQSI